jgi:2',3'-cyclic-nucleotide 2'-phosphodiesterase (5'-nucleotidase family)
MGGLSRKLAYINTLNNSSVNPLILDAGGALFAHTQYSVLNLPSVQYKAKAFLEGMEKIGCDAFNIGDYDLAAGYDFLKSFEKNSKIPFISANLRVTKSGDLAFKPFKILEKNKLKIGIIGVTDYLPQTVSELYKENYLETGKKYINQLKDEVDILVMLVGGHLKQKNTILESFKDADYIYLSRAVSNTRSTVPQQDGYPVFYTIGLSGKHLIEVKTTLNNDISPVIDVTSYETQLSNIVRQLIRLKTTENGQSIEEKYAEQPQVLAQIQHFEKRVKEIENSINKVVNKSEIKIVSLPKSMDYDVEMQSFIDKAIEEAKNQ